MPDAVKKARSERLLALSEEGRQAFAGSLAGSTVEVLFEEGGQGLTSDYVRVWADGGAPNTFGTVRVTALCENGVQGELIDG